MATGQSQIPGDCRRGLGKSALTVWQVGLNSSLSGCRTSASFPCADVGTSGVGCTWEVPTCGTVWVREEEGDQQHPRWERGPPSAVAPGTSFSRGAELMMGQCGESEPAGWRGAAGRHRGCPRGCGGAGKADRGAMGRLRGDGVLMGSGKAG